MAGLNNTEFAKLVGVNEGIIRRAIKKGRIIVSPDGTIDSETQVARWNLTRDHGRVHDGKPRERGRPKTATTAEAQSVEVKVFEDIAALEKRQLELQVGLLQAKLDGALAASVSKEETRRALASFSRLCRDKWVNFGNRYGQQIAAACGIDPKLLMAELDKAVRLQLDEIASVKATLPE